MSGEMDKIREGDAERARLDSRLDRMAMDRMSDERLHRAIRNQEEVVQPDRLTQDLALALRATRTELTRLRDLVERQGKVVEAAKQVHQCWLDRKGLSVRVGDTPFSNKDMARMTQEAKDANDTLHATLLALETGKEK